MYFSYKDYIDIRIYNCYKTLNRIKGVFKLPNCIFRCGKNVSMLYSPIFGKWLDIHIGDVMWKDKFDTPRFERGPIIRISIFKYSFMFYWTCVDANQYWEQVLWYLYYKNTGFYGLVDSPDVSKARESWPWKDYDTNESTWNDDFLVNNYK